MGEPAYQLPEDDKPDIRPDLRALEGGGETTPSSRDHLKSVDDSDSAGGLFNKDGDEGDSPRRHLRSIEGGKDNSDGLYNKEGDDPKRLGGLRGAYGRLRNRKNQLTGSIAKHKWLWGVGAGAFASMAGFIVLLFILLAALKIPHLAENITAYQFARVFQRAAETNERVTSEKIAVDAADQGMYGRLKAKYDATGTKVSEQWSKLDKYQPNKVIANMDEANTLKFNYKNTAWGGQKIASITMGNTTMLVKSKTTLQKLIPSYDFVKGLGSENIGLVQQYQTALKEGFRAQEVGPITRGLVAKEIRQRLGISLTAWALAKYKNMDEQKARLQEARDAHTKIATPDPSDPKTSTLKDAKEKVLAAEDDTIAKDPALLNTLESDNVGDMPEVRAALNASIKPSGFQTALGFANPTYAVMVPACIVYDGSVDRSGSTVDSQSAAQMKEYQYIASAADQQKDGTNASELPVGALNDRIGDIGSSIPLERASNPANASTTAGTSAEASPGGTFSLLNALFGGGKATSAVNAAADAMCPVLTNTGVAVGISIVSIISAFVSGGGTTAGADAAGNIASRVIDRVAASFVERLGSKAAIKESLGKSGAIIKDSIKSGGKIAGMTILAKMIVASQSGYLTNGIDGGNDLANNADAGGNLMANEVNREQFYGRPLNGQETSQAVNDSLVYVSKQNETKSAYQRYFAVSNPASLLTRVGTAMSGSLHNFSLSTGIGGLGDKLLSPLSTFGNMLVQSNQHFALAASNPADQTYGNVQFDWSAEEVALSKKPEYSMLENQRILEASGQEDTIAGTYGECFDGGTTVGTLLQDGNIVRDENGNVDPDQGTCAPRNLGPDDHGNFKSAEAQLVFRWRLTQRDNKGLDTVLDEQTITTDTASDATSSFKIASYNVQGLVHASSTWHQRLSDVENVITKNNIDIVGLQELESPQRSALLSDLGSTFDIYPSKPDYSDLSSPNSIIWDKSKFKLVDGGTQPNLKYFNGAALNAPWVELQYLATGQDFYVLNTHDPAHAENADLRYQNALEHVKFIQSLQSDNLPILYAGDFNSGYDLRPPGDGNATYQNKAENLTYCILNKDNLMQDAYDAANSRQFKCPNPALNNTVDHVYVSNEVKVTDFTMITGNIGTDHGGVPSAVVCLGSCNSSGAGSQFRIATYNMHVHTTAAQNQVAIDNMKNNHFDVVGMQELSYPGTFNTVKSKLRAAGYDIYPGKYIGTWEMNSSAITWNTSKFDLVKTDSVTYPAGDKASPTRIGAPTTSPILWLKDKGTGQEIIVMNAHTFAFGAAYGGPELRRKAAQVFTAKIQSLQSENLPILFTGDFNEGYGPLGTTYCSLETRGLMISPFVDNPNEYCKNGGKVWAMGAVDHILTSPGIKGTANELTAKGPRGYEGVFANLGTDHRQVPYSDITIPGSGGNSQSSGANQDAKNGWQWPLTKADYNGLSQCFFHPIVHGDIVTKSGHTGIDLRAGVGTPVYAAHDGTVVKTDPAGTSDGGKYIIIKNGNGLYSNYQHNSQILVKAGQTVKAGQKISMSGNTGFTTGPHLHFSITTQPGLDSRNSVAYSVDPIPYLPNDRNTSPCQ